VRSGWGRNLPHCVNVAPRDSVLAYSTFLQDLQVCQIENAFQLDFQFVNPPTLVRELRGINATRFKLLATSLAAVLASSDV
jgi:hypothetical protein